MKPLDPRLLREVRSTPVYLVGMAVVGLALAAALVAQAALLASIITRVFLDGARLADVRGSLVALALVVAARAGLIGLRELVGRLTAGRVTSELRRRVLGRAVELGPVGLARERRGELAATATTGLEALDIYFAGYLPQLVLAVVVPVVVLVRLLPLDPTAVVIMALTLPLIPLFMALVGWATDAHTAKRWQVLTRLSAHFLDVIEGLATLRAFGRAEAQEGTIEAVGDDYRRATMATLRISFLSALVLELLATLSVALVAVAVGLRVVDGGLALEPALTVLVLAPEVYLPLRQVGARFHDSMAGLEACDRAFAVLDTTPPVDPAPTGPGGPGVDEVSRLLRTAPLVLDRVGFVYPGRDERVLGDISLTVAPGATVSVIGRSGAGKTTLSSLLLRFADPSEGGISIGGVDVRRLPLEAWRGALGWLPQHPHLLTASVAENVRIARPGATDADVRAALAAANLLEVVEALPDGIDTRLREEAADLSAGERRRLALARVFLRDAPLVVVDEPTANLDGESAAAVLESLARLQHRATLVVVAHRPLLASDVVLEVAGGSARPIDGGTVPWAR